MRYISLFSGAGGLDAGLAAVGGHCVCAIEMDADSCETLRLNGHKHVIEAQIETLPPLSLRESLGVQPGEIDLIVGGPPCQPFSKSALWTNKAARGLLDQRTKTLFHFFEYVTEFKPRAFLLENVEGFARLGGLNYVEQSLSQMRKRGLSYNLSCNLVDAASYGVPQRRRRFLAVGVKEGAPLVLPKPKYGVDKPYKTAWDAISNTTNLSGFDEELAVRGRWAGLLASIPPGANYLWHTSRGGGMPLFGWRTRYWSFLLKLDPNLPSPTLVANPSQNSGPFHWDNRLLSTRELAAIQTFPQNYHFAGSRASRQRQVGNAVPPLLAATIGVAIAKHLKHPSKSIGPLVGRRSRRTPDIPETNEVPLEYRELAGLHAAHPGTGKGPHPRMPIALDQNVEFTQSAASATAANEMAEA